MDDREQLPPVRFRAVIEMSFPNADPWDPTDYDNVIEQWRKSLEENPTFNCKDVVIREILTIGGLKDDYGATKTCLTFAREFELQVEPLHIVVRRKRGRNVAMTERVDHRQVGRK
jgi:hypothetical protein